MMVWDTPYTTMASKLQSITCAARLFGSRTQHRYWRRLFEDAMEAGRRPVGVQGQPRSPGRVSVGRVTVSEALTQSVILRVSCARCNGRTGVGWHQCMPGVARVVCR